MDFLARKKEILEYFDNQITPSLIEITKSDSDQRVKAKLVNKAVNEAYTTLDALIDEEANETKQNSQIILNYCYAVKALDYRNSVWSYEYMALSRRVGELWERFCKAAWDHPTRPNVKRINAPSFEGVLAKIEDNILKNSKTELIEQTKTTISLVKDLVGSISMSEDEMFTVDDTPHIIDFKSGFGSNEKGNMLRLQAVGKAYKLWNADTNLLLLVRQLENNNYLNVMKRDGLWTVKCGDEAYSVIDELTGSDFTEIREVCVDFDSDFSDNFKRMIGQQQGNLKSYFVW